MSIFSDAFDNGGFDRVIVTAPDGVVRDFSRSEYERLPLTERVVLLLEVRARFFRGQREIPPAQALK